MVLFAAGFAVAEHGRGLRRSQSACSRQRRHGRERTTTSPIRRTALPTSTTPGYSATALNVASKWTISQAIDRSRAKFGKAALAQFDPGALEIRDDDDVVDVVLAIDIAEADLFLRPEGINRRISEIRLCRHSPASRQCRPRRHLPWKLRLALLHERAAALDVVLALEAGLDHGIEFGVIGLARRLCRSRSRKP